MAAASNQICSCQCSLCAVTSVQLVCDSAVILALTAAAHTRRAITSGASDSAVAGSLVISHNADTSLPNGPDSSGASHQERGTEGTAALLCHDMQPANANLNG